MTSYFTPPTWTFSASSSGPEGKALFGRLKYQVGYGVIRDQTGGYRQVVVMDAEEATAAREVYLGGRTYKITAQNVTDLTAAGYGAYVTRSTTKDIYVDIYSDTI